MATHGIENWGVEDPEERAEKWRRRDQFAQTRALAMLTETENVKAKQRSLERELAGFDDEGIAELMALIGSTGGGISMRSTSEELSEALGPDVVDRLVGGMHDHPGDRMLPQLPVDVGGFPVCEVNGVVEQRNQRVCHLAHGKQRGANGVIQFCSHVRLSSFKVGRLVALGVDVAPVPRTTPVMHHHP